MRKNKTATRNVRIFFDQNKAINLFSILNYDLYSFNNKNIKTVPHPSVCRIAILHVNAGITVEIYLLKFLAKASSG